MPFGNEIYLSKFLGSWPFRTYVVMGSTSKILGVFSFLFMHLQEEVPFGNEIYFSKSVGSQPFKIYMVMGSISKILGVVAFLFMHLQEGDALWK